MELAEDLPDVRTVLVPVGGGGLVAGVALAVKSHRPDVRVIGVQAETLPAMKLALESRERVTLPPASTIADGIGVRQVGELTLTLAQRHVDEVVTVTEEELANAILLLLEIEKTVVEGAGATTLAAVLNKKVALAGKRVALIENGQLSELYVERKRDRGVAGNIYKGRVVRVLPGMQSAFVDVGLERAAFLHVADLHTSNGARAEGAPLVRTMLERAPTLICLITSRQALDLSGEDEFRVLPLPLPGAADTPEQLLRCESVQLLVDRSQKARPDFQVTSKNAASVAGMILSTEALVSDSAKGHAVGASSGSRGMYD